MRKGRCRSITGPAPAFQSRAQDTRQGDISRISINCRQKRSIGPQSKRRKIMPRGPKGEKRPADVIGAAVMVGRIATGEIEEGTPPPDDGKDPAAVALGRKGGKARAAGMTDRRRKDIAKKAAQKRWGK